MVNQIAALQKKICSLEKDLEVILLHISYPNAESIKSDNQITSAIIERIIEIRNSSKENKIINEQKEEQK